MGAGRPRTRLNQILLAVSLTGVVISAALRYQAEGRVGEASMSPLLVVLQLCAMAVFLPIPLTLASIARSGHRWSAILRAVPRTGWISLAVVWVATQLINLKNFPQMSGESISPTLFPSIHLMFFGVSLVYHAYFDLPIRALLREHPPATTTGADGDQS